MISQKILLIRHAESAFNVAQRKARGSTTEIVNFADESRSVKFDPELLDASLTEEGIQQCFKGRSLLMDLQVDVVLVSPLRRAIQTAFFMFQDHPNRPRFIVEPMLREMLSSSCDFGGRLAETMQEYPEFDYSRLLDNQNIKASPNMWTLEYLRHDKGAIAKEYIHDVLKKTKGSYNIHGPGIFVEYLSQYQNDTFENFFDILERINALKEYLKRECVNQKIACVTHSRILQMTSATEYDEIGKSKNGQWVENAKSIQLSL